MSSQKFAWRPKLVWNMKTRDFYFQLIWLCWYWDDGYDSEAIFYRLTDEDETPMSHKRYTRTSNNYW